MKPRVRGSLSCYPNPASKSLTGQPSLKISFQRPLSGARVFRIVIDNVSKHIIPPLLDIATVGPCARKIIRVLSNRVCKDVRVSLIKLYSIGS